jgi:hypothetical protein
MRVGIIGGGFGLTVQAPIINTHPKMNVSAVSTMKLHQLPKDLFNRGNSPAQDQESLGTLMMPFLYRVR